MGGQSVDGQAEKTHFTFDRVKSNFFDFMGYVHFTCKSSSFLLLLILTVTIMSSCGYAYRCNILALSVP